MTQIRIDYNPKTLQVSVPLQIIMPNPGWNGQSEDDQRKLPVLYLLHGLSDDSSAWQRYTNLEMGPGFHRNLAYGWQVHVRQYGQRTGVFRLHHQRITGISG
jgi:hypothetical protein